MTHIEPSLSFGIEEEYYLVNRESRALVADPPREMIAELRQRIGKPFSEEFMRSQIEIATPVCQNADQARASLVEMRSAIAETLSRFDVAPIASGTHPFSHWRKQRHRNRPRYNGIAEDFQAVGRRMVICGLHVHIGIESRDQRIALMNTMLPYLPLFLALSTSSPFWGGDLTGLKSYRTAVNDATPRKGIPERFENWRDFERKVGVLSRAGIIDDASKIWWDIRPSIQYETLEVRIMDVCPIVDDAVCLASLLRCLSRYLCRNDFNPHSLIGSQLLINENRWRAQRYGLDEGLLDPETGQLQPVGEIVERLLDILHDDALALGCEAEIYHAMTIVGSGTSADRQLQHYEMQLEHGATARTALASVVDRLIEDTVTDAPPMTPRRSSSRCSSTTISSP